MEKAREDRVISLNQQSPCEWAKLLGKLRWIGLEGEARRLELALSTLPPEERGVSAEPLGTD